MKLKSCPFCGGEAKMTYSFVDGPARCGVNYHVYCVECRAMSGGWDTEETAAAAWNQRKKTHRRD